MPITKAQLDQLEELRKETERMRERLKELKNRPVVSASRLSGARSAGSGRSDHVCSIVEAQDELERMIDKNLAFMKDLINIIFCPWDLSNPCTPSEYRVWELLRLRCIVGLSWDEIGKRKGVKGATCRQVVSRYKRKLQ